MRQSKLDEEAKQIGEADGFGGIPATQPPLTTSRERRDISPQLSVTLEHILGQLDVLTQVCRRNISEQGIILEFKILGGGAGMHSCPWPHHAATHWGE